MAFWNKNKETDPEPESEEDKSEEGSEKEVDPFNLDALGWDKYGSDEMVKARKEITFAHIREHGAKFIDCFEEFMLRDRDPWCYGNLQIDFEGRHFTMYSEEDFIEHLKEAEKTAGSGHSKLIKSSINLSASSRYPDVFWESLHDNYDKICEHLNKIWSTSFNVRGWETPTFSSVREFNDFLEKNNHPKIKWQRTNTSAHQKTVNTSGNANSVCLTTP